MERKISTYLHKWKNDLVRKPLLLYGPRQIGKTFSVLEFGDKEYKNVSPGKIFQIDSYAIYDICNYSKKDLVVQIVLPNSD